MAYWDDTPETLDTVVRRVIWRVEIFGDLEGDFELVAHIQKERSAGGSVISTEDMGEVRIRNSEAQADVALGPFATKIRNGCRGLVRAIKNA